MNYEFKSIFKDVIKEMLDEKHSLGFKYDSELWKLKELDQLAINLNLSDCTLSKEFSILYVTQKPNEKKINVTHRVRVIRELAKFMNRKGYKSYVLPPLPKGSYHSDFVPYIFTEDEVKRIFEAIDQYASQKSLDGRYYHQCKKYSVIFRILYSTGMRIGEVLSMKVKDIDFDKKTFTIMKAKNNRERIIPVHHNLLKRIEDYMKEENIFTLDSYLFGNRYGNAIDKTTVDAFFLKFLSLAGIKHPEDGPRVHSFRHTFCVHRLKMWVLEGRDITALFPYLCAYLGHADTRCTEYYLRLTADLYPDIVSKSEKYLEGGDSDE